MANTLINRKKPARPPNPRPQQFQASTPPSLWGQIMGQYGKPAQPAGPQQPAQFRPQNTPSIWSQLLGHLGTSQPGSPGVPPQPMAPPTGPFSFGPMNQLGTQGPGQPGWLESERQPGGMFTPQGQAMAPPFDVQRTQMRMLPDPSVPTRPEPAPDFAAGPLGTPAERAKAFIGIQQQFGGDPNQTRQRWGGLERILANQTISPETEMEAQQGLNAGQEDVYRANPGSRPLPPAFDRARQSMMALNPQLARSYPGGPGRAGPATQHPDMAGIDQRIAIATMSPLEQQQALTQRMGLGGAGAQQGPTPFDAMQLIRQAAPSATAGFRRLGGTAFGDTSPGQEQVNRPLTPRMEAVVGDQTPVRLAGIHQMGGQIDFGKWTAAKRAAQEDANAGIMPNYVGPWHGPGASRAPEGERFTPEGRTQEFFGNKAQYTKNLDEREAALGLRQKRVMLKAQGLPHSGQDAQAAMMREQIMGRMGGEGHEATPAEALGMGMPEAAAGMTAVQGAQAGREQQDRHVQLADRTARIAQIPALLEQGVPIELAIAMLGLGGTPGQADMQLAQQRSIARKYGFPQYMIDAIK